MQDYRKLADYCCTHLNILFLLYHNQKSLLIQGQITFSCVVPYITAELIEEQTDLRHVHVINEDDEALARRRTVRVLGAFLHVSLQVALYVQ